MMQPLRGRLCEKPIPALFCEIAGRGLSGELRLKQGNVTRSIYFQAGDAIAASSSLADEQIEQKLVKRGSASLGLVETAKRRQPDSRRLGQTLVEMGIVTEEVRREAAKDLDMEILGGLFETSDAEYYFEDSLPPDIQRSIESPTLELALEGARISALSPRTADLVAPLDRIVMQTELASSPVATRVALTSTEGLVLMRVDSPVSIEDLVLLTGLGEQETRKAVCVLVSLGLLASVEPQKPLRATGPIQSQSSTSVTPEMAPDSLLEGIDRKLRIFEKANLYEVMGVSKIAPMSQINAAFENLDQMFGSYRKLYPNDARLKEKLDQLFALIRKAHETLRDPDKRRSYDRPADPRPPVKPVIERSEAQPVLRSVPLPSLIATSIPTPVPPPNAQSRQVPSAPPQSNGSFEVTESRQPGVLNTAQAALSFYQQGRARYDQGDVHGAEHLLRQAVKLEPNEWHYHFHLGMVLAVLSQARHNHSHAEGCHVTCKIGAGLVRNQRVRHDAEQHLLKAAELDPMNPKIRLNLALLYKDAGMTKKAEQFFYETLLLDGKNKTALRELGLDAQSADDLKPDLLSNKGLFKR